MNPFQLPDIAFWREQYEMLEKATQRIHKKMAEIRPYIRVVSDSTPIFESRGQDIPFWCKPDALGEFPLSYEITFEDTKHTQVYQPIMAHISFRWIYHNIKIRENIEKQEGSQYRPEHIERIIGELPRNATEVDYDQIVKSISSYLTEVIPYDFHPRPKPTNIILSISWEKPSALNLKGYIEDHAGILDEIIVFPSVTFTRDQNGDFPLTEITQGLTKMTEQIEANCDLIAKSSDEVARKVEMDDVE